MSQPAWTMVLAAGAGRRVAGITGGVPKQFWSLDGGPSLVEQTVDRLATLAPPHQRVTVVDRAHRDYVAGLAGSARLGRVVYQPCDRGTAVGVLLGLDAIGRSEPDAAVVIAPSDHAVAQAAQFRAGIRHALALVGAQAVGVILFGVEPGFPVSDLGWITPDESSRRFGSDRIRPVAGFVEKPSASQARRLFASGAVWNTMVLVARASALMALFERHLPELTSLFTHTSFLPPARRDAILAELYPQMPPADLSRDVLTPAEGLAVYTWPASLGWSDLGTPERLERLRRSA